MNFKSFIAKAVAPSVALASMALGASSLADNHKGVNAASCSSSTLNGTYLYQSNGNEAGKPYSEAGMEIYDGAGEVKTTYMSTTGPSTVTGRYSIKADCTGTIRYSNGEGNSIFVSPSGDRFVYIVSGERGKYGKENASSGWEIRVTK